jgi:AraC family transcriptional regulator, regulatory protein of adaptative response / methylated-DNA-[protein]-cysteine methyltransferase
MSQKAETRARPIAVNVMPNRRSHTMKPGSSPPAHAASLRAGISACSLGHVLVAASARGVCAVILGDRPEAMFAELRARFRGAPLEASDATHAALAAEVVSIIDGARSPSNLPLDLVGSPFQQKVWRELRAIPRGTTRTYSEIARRIGSPRAVRAVGTACGKNPVAVAVPCHRVLREDGSLGGYRWGLDRKRELLAAERLRDVSGAAAAPVSPAPRAARLPLR